VTSFFAKMPLQTSLWRDIIDLQIVIRFHTEAHMELEWITPLQASEKWGITERQVQSMCSHGKIRGVVRLSKVWLIPKDAQRPIDGRTKVAKELKQEGI